MTLANLKQTVKNLSFISLVIVYTLGVFLLGRYTKSEAESKKTKEEASSLLTPQEMDESTKTQSARVLPSFVKLCTNTSLGFEIAYPKDWFTTYNQQGDQCRFFAPYSFVLPQDTSGEKTPILVEVSSPAIWEETMLEYERPNEYYNVLSSVNLEISQRAAKKIEAITTGQDSQEKGFTKVSYLIFDDENPLIISYNQLNANTDIEREKIIFEEMIKSLNFL